MNSDNVCDFLHDQLVMAYVKLIKNVVICCFFITTDNAAVGGGMAHAYNRCYGGTVVGSQNDNNLMHEPRELTKNY